MWPVVWFAEKSLFAQERATLIAQLSGAAQQAAVDLGATIVPGGRGKPKSAAQQAMARPGVTLYPSGVVPGMPMAGMPGMMPGMPFPAVGMPAAPVGLAVGLPSRAVILRNMFDPSEETEEGWDLDICEDVKEECEKHGPVVHVSVEKNSSVGVVYVLFK